MSFGEQLRRLMAERGVSLRTLAKQVPCDAGHLSKVSHGHKTPSAKLAERLDEFLGAEGRLAARRPATGRRALYGDLTPDDEERLLMAASKPARVDLTVVRSLEAILAAQRRMEDRIGSAPILAPVQAQLAALEDLVRDARGPIRPKVVNVAAQWAQFHGWLKANTGDLESARTWLDRALEWSVETDDANLVAEVLSFKGHVAWMAEEIGPMVGLSAAALRGDGLYPGQYAISSAQEARGHAMAGEAYEAEQRLEQADEHAAAARERADEAPPWLYYHSPGFFELQRGLAYRYLGRRDASYNNRAIDALNRGLDELPADMRPSEWAGEFTYQLGRAHLQADDREEAERLAGGLDDLARRIDSERLGRQAAALRW